VGISTHSIYNIISYLFLSYKKRPSLILKILKIFGKNKTQITLVIFLLKQTGNRAQT
jgi:hypothetical protein